MIFPHPTLSPNQVVQAVPLLVALCLAGCALFLSSCRTPGLRWFTKFKSLRFRGLLGLQAVEESQLGFFRVQAVLEDDDRLQQ